MTAAARKLHKPALWSPFVGVDRGFAFYIAVRPDLIAFGKRLSVARHRRGMSAGAAARRCGLAVAAYVAVEAGALAPTGAVEAFLAVIEAEIAASAGKGRK
jgi:Helix-turn-helix domain